MKDKIKAKINEVIENILSKDAKEITYSEYCILDGKLSALKWEEEQAAKGKEMAELVAKTFSFNSVCQKPLPEPKEV